MAQATSMAELMAKKQPSVTSVKKGEVIPGTITKLTSGEILVDIGAKTEAVVLEKDKGILHTLLNSLKVGDKVTVSVLNPESDQGNPVVSLRRFIDEQIWGDLEKLKDDKTVQEVTVTDITKGGFLVSTNEGMNGFLPNSQTMLNDASSTFIGKTIKVVVLEINRSFHKIIYSQKAAIGDEDFSKIISEIKVGQIVDAIVSNTASFGIFVSIKHISGSDDTIEGFIHLSELSWDKIESAENFYKAGEKIKVQIIGIDKETKRINLSVKRLTKDPFEDATKQYSIDKKVKGKVVKIGSIGVGLELGEGVEGLIKKDKLPPGTDYKIGDEVEGTVTEIDVKRHKIILVPVLKEKPMGYR